jgi:hypothetical protein
MALLKMLDVVDAASGEIVEYVDLFSTTDQLFCKMRAYKPK